MTTRFWCRVFSIDMTRSSCGMRHAETQRPGERAKWILRSPQCVRCKVGKVHAGGGSARKWPDGSPVVVMMSLKRKA